MSHAKSFFEEASHIALRIDHEAVERVVDGLCQLRERKGRLFILGVGGSAANASHAVNDFRKLCDLEAYAPTDNVAELTARTNDEGWETVFEAWLKTSQACENDAVLVFSVGGGDAERHVSANLVYALDEARRRGLKIYGIVGPEGGYTRLVGDEVISVPVHESSRITPHCEAFQAVIWHALVSHPRLMIHSTKWEAIQRAPLAP